MAILCANTWSVWKGYAAEYTIIPEYGNVGGSEVVRLHFEMVEVERKKLCNVPRLDADLKQKREGKYTMKVPQKCCGAS